MKPVLLGPNQPRQFYRGGAAIGALRGDTAADFGPEDWVASTTTRFGQDTEGLTRLPDGRWLRDAVATDPSRWLGPDHVRVFRESPALLVKLLDAGQRLPVHFHPSDAFARRHFDSHFGKAEAWVVIGTSGENPVVHAGFAKTQDPQVVADWVRDQDAPAMLDALNRFEVRPGDTVYIPPGLPHSIGEGVFVVELQQPTDFSLTIEWRDFLESPQQGHLGLGFDTALNALDTSGWDDGRLTGLVRRNPGDESTVDLLTPKAGEYFRATQLKPGGEPIALDASFAVLVVLDGEGELRTEYGGTLPLAKGGTLVVPHGAGDAELTGAVTVIRCQPPEPREAR